MLPVHRLALTDLIPFVYDLILLTLRENYLDAVTGFLKSRQFFIIIIICTVFYVNNIMDNCPY